MTLAMFSRFTRPSLMALSWLAFTVTSWAHPGHEGHEDGGDFVWTSDHLRQHPGATVLCFAFLGLLVWALIQFVRFKKSKAAASHSPSAETLS
jgi:hydrogenase/urease accessory protein HupE